jgi:hypothetical protein
MTSATADLQQEVDELKAKVRELSQTPEERQEAAHERWVAAMAKQAEKETPAAAFVRQQIELEQRRTQEWLYCCGVPSDASSELKSLALGLTEHRSQTIFIDLVAACAGAELDRLKATMPQMAKLFPKLPAPVRAAIVQAARDYAQLRSQVLGW